MKTLFSKLLSLFSTPPCPECGSKKVKANVIDVDHDYLGYSCEKDHQWFPVN